MANQNFGNRWHKAQLDPVDDEIARLSFLCDIRLLDDGIIDRVLAGDESVCGKPNPPMFKKLRDLIKMHYLLTEDSLKSIGPEETGKLLAENRKRLQRRFNLGGQVRE